MGKKLTNTQLRLQAKEYCKSPIAVFALLKKIQSLECKIEVLESELQLMNDTIKPLDNLKFK